jgi:hypothetical protein
VGAFLQPMPARSQCDRWLASQVARLPWFFVARSAIVLRPGSEDLLLLLILDSFLEPVALDGRLFLCGFAGREFRFDSGPDLPSSSRRFEQLRERPTLSARGLEWI